VRVVVQRVARASVTVDDEVVGSIGDGLRVLLGVTHDDGPARHGLRILPAAGRDRGYSPGAPQTGNHRDRSASIRSSSPTAARTCSSRAVSRCCPPSGANG
jgi:hypothetical protein